MQRKFNKTYGVCVYLGDQISSQSVFIARKRQMPEVNGTDNKVAFYTVHFWKHSLFYLYMSRCFPTYQPRLERNPHL